MKQSYGPATASDPKPVTLGGRKGFSCSIVYLTFVPGASLMPPLRAACVIEYSKAAPAISNAGRPNSCETDAPKFGLRPVPSVPSRCLRYVDRFAQSSDDVGASVTGLCHLAPNTEGGGLRHMSAVFQIRSIPSKGDRYPDTESRRLKPAFSDFETAPDTGSSAA